MEKFRFGAKYDFGTLEEAPKLKFQLENSAIVRSGIPESVNEENVHFLDSKSWHKVQATKLDESLFEKNLLLKLSLGTGRFCYNL